MINKKNKNILAIAAATGIAISSLSGCTNRIDPTATPEIAYEYEDITQVFEPYTHFLMIYTNISNKSYDVYYEVPDYKIPDGYEILDAKILDNNKIEYLLINNRSVIASGKYYDGKYYFDSPGSLIDQTLSKKR